MTLIQGPPGTGKTRVLAGIVANMYLNHNWENMHDRWAKPEKQILVVTSMNLTADLVAEALCNIQFLKDNVCRVYSKVREDIFNADLQKLPEWSLLHKLLFYEK